MSGLDGLWGCRRSSRGQRPLLEHLRSHGVQVLLLGGILIGVRGAISVLRRLAVLVSLVARCGSLVSKVLERRGLLGSLVSIARRHGSLGNSGRWGQVRRSWHRRVG